MTSHQMKNFTYNNFPLNMSNGPSMNQNKLSKGEMLSMYKPSGRMTPVDINCGVDTPPRVDSRSVSDTFSRATPSVAGGNQIVQKEVVQGHSVFRQTSPPAK